ncbi:MAG: hypothetical protein CL608_24900 [Anaerolineaceae bacterium]|nr:hypothetical protein [Anaerolineaceae bacterium]
MTDLPLFGDVLQQYVNRSAYTAGQLSRLSGIPKTTIVSWLNGQVQKPQTADGLTQLAKILHLNKQETESLLHAAGHLPHPKRTAVTNSSAPFQAVPKLPYFSGRERLIAQIEATILDAGQENIVCLHGMGGVGKTALAAELAYRLRPSFPDGVLWLEMNRTGPMAALATMAHGYGLDVSPFADVAGRARAVSQLLADKQFLLVLDDVQRSAEIADILPTTPGCTVLITTRRRDLAAAIGGQRFEIRPFSAEEDDALNLFHCLLQRDFDNDEKEALWQIAELLGYLPLALAIAASRLAYEPGWHVADFLARLQQTAVSLDVLTFEDLSVQRSFALSYEQLPAHLQQFLAGLTIFGGHSFTDTAVATVHNLPLIETQDSLRTLHNLSLIQAQAGEADTRYQLHPLLQACVQKLPMPENGRVEAEQNYVRYYLSHVQSDLAAAFQDVALFREALRLAERHKLWSEFLYGLEAAYPALQFSLSPKELERLLQSAESVAERLGQTEVVIWCRLRRVALARHQAAVPTISETLRSLTVLTREPRLARYRPAVCLAKGKTAVSNGNWIAANQYYEEGVHLAQTGSPSPHVLIDLWQAQGNLARWRGQQETAVSLYQQALSLAQQTQDPFRLATLYDHLAWLAIEQDDYDAADAAGTQGMAIAEKMGHRERLAILYNTLAVVRHHQGDWAESQRYQQAGFDYARSLHLKAHAASIAANRGGLAWQKGRVAQAEQFWQESDLLAQQSQDVNNLVNVRLYRAGKYLQAEQYVKSLMQYRAVLAALPPQASRTSCGYGKGSLGIVQSLLGLGQKNAARPYLMASLTAFARVDLPMVAEIRRLALSLQIDLEDIPQF